MDKKTEIMRPRINNDEGIHTTIKRNKQNEDFQNTSVKKMFNRDELKSFTERCDYTMIHKKITDDTTDVFIDIEDHYKEEDDVKIGYVIDGKYELFELITKKSGEAAIFKCHVDGVLGTFVAKVYYPNIQPKEDIMEKLMSNLSSENVVKLNMIGFVMTSQGRRLYEIMPYYGKGNLEMRMPLCEEEIIEKIIPQLNEGLKSIHRLNIIHRDLKPNNLFIDSIGDGEDKKEGYKLTDDERIVIGDFGISSQIKDGQTHRVTSASRTRGYGAPETIRDNITTPKSDYFSFGITLLTLLYGEYPYHDEVEMILKIKDNLWDFPNGTSTRMKKLIMGLMDYDRNIRFGYEEVKAWLENKNVVVDDRRKRRFEDVQITTPYEFKFKKYYHLVDLVEAMIQDWNFALQHIENRFIDKYFRGVSKEFDEILTDMDRLRHIGAGDEKIFMTLIYSVLECKGIIYGDLNFSSINDMTEYILQSKEVDKRIVKLVRNKSLYFIISLINKYSSSVEDIAKLKVIIERCEAKMKNDEEVGFYLLGFALNEDGLNIDIMKKGLIPGYNSITNVAELYESFKKADSKESYSDLLMQNKLFIAWLAYKGYSKDKYYLK